MDKTDIIVSVITDKKKTHSFKHPMSNVMVDCFEADFPIEMNMPRTHYHYLYLEDKVVVYARMPKKSYLHYKNLVKDYGLKLKKASLLKLKEREKSSKMELLIRDNQNIKAEVNNGLSKLY